MNQCSRIARLSSVPENVSAVASKAVTPCAVAACQSNTASQLDAITETGNSAFIGAWRK